jgi:O-antigen/teichoic acid export membrane protein
MSDTNNKLAGQIKRGFIWNFAEQVSYKVIQFIIQLVLARILLPDDYGLCALVLAFINIADVFVKSGFSSALIQKKEAKSIDFSSVCYFCIGIAVILYIILFFTSSYIAEFFEDTRIANVMRVMGLVLIIGAFNSVQIAIVYKNMQFKKSFAGNILGMAVSAVAGIIAALQGLGVWALVIQYVTNKIVNCFTFYRLVRWLPKREFSFASIKQLFSYGWKLMVSSVFQTVSADIYALVIGKFFTKAQLGVYDTGQKIPANLGNTIASTMGGVLFPAFSKIQDDPEKMRSYLKKINSITSFVIFPFMMGIAAMAAPLVDVILTDKWASAVPIMQIVCFIYMFYPIHLANLQIATAVGRTDISMWQEITKKILDIVMLIITVRLGLIWVTIGLLISSTLALWVNIEPNNKFIHYNTIRQLWDIMPSFIIGLTTASVMYVLVLFLDVNNFVLLILQAISGFVVFTLLTFMFNRNTYNMVKQHILNLRG